MFDLPVFNTLIPVVIIPFCLGGEIGAYGHGEPVGQQIGDAEYDDNTVVEVRTYCTGNHGKGGDTSIDPAIDEFGQIEPKAS